MPPVASDPSSVVAAYFPPRPPAPSPATDPAPATPFENMLDDRTQAASDPPPQSPARRKSRSRRTTAIKAIPPHADQGRREQARRRESRGRQRRQNRRRQEQTSKDGEPDVASTADASTGLAVVPVRWTATVSTAKADCRHDARAKPADGKPTDGKSADSKASDGTSSDARPPPKAATDTVTLRSPARPPHPPRSLSRPGHRYRRPAPPPARRSRNSRSRRPVPTVTEIICPILPRQKRPAKPQMAARRKPAQRPPTALSRKAPIATASVQSDSKPQNRATTAKTRSSSRVTTSPRRRITMRMLQPQPMPMPLCQKPRTPLNR